MILKQVAGQRLICKTVSKSNCRMVESSNRGPWNIVEPSNGMVYNGRIVESSNGIVESWTSRAVELVQWCSGGIVESSDG